MTDGTLNNVKVAGIACAVPDNKVDISFFYEKFGETNVKKFSKMTGVKSRYVSAKEQTSSDLAYVAAEKLLSELKWDRSSIDGVIFVTQTPDYRVPSTACVLHKRLGLGTNCLAFDVNLGCSGYVYGTHMVATYMQCENMKRMLLLVGDTSNAMISEEDKSSAMLFGEGGAATAFEREENAEKINYLMRTNGEGFKAIIIPSGAFRNLDGKAERYEFEEGVIRSDYELYMNGTTVFNFTISDVPQTICEFKQKFGLNNDNIDMYVMHQANLFMLKTIAGRADIPIEKMPISMDRYGNTSVTSIPLTICDACERLDIHKKINLVCAGFGIGLSWGVISMQVDSDKCFPIIYTNDYYTEGGLSAND